jgi:transcription elongation GreA/GreB family factor
LEAREAATHSESRQEGKYDTRGLEASYLAGAQAKRAAEISELIQFYRFLEMPSFSNDSPIAATALVSVQSAQQVQHYFIVPKGMGMSLTVKGTSVQIVTPQSRLGQELIGRSSGDDFEVEIAGKKKNFEILSVI